MKRVHQRPPELCVCLVLLLLLLLFVLLLLLTIIIVIVITIITLYHAALHSLAGAPGAEGPGGERPAPN